jgi:hypothetical protein
MKMIRPGPVVLSNLLIFSLACPSAFAGGGLGKMLEQQGQSMGEQEGQKILSTEESKLQNAYEKKKLAKQAAGQKTVTGTLDKGKTGAASTASQSTALKEQVAEKQAVTNAAKKESQGKSLFRKAEQSMEKGAEQDAAGWATRHMP